MSKPKRKATQPKRNATNNSKWLDLKSMQLAGVCKQYHYAVRGSCGHKSHVIVIQSRLCLECFLAERRSRNVPS